MHPVAVQQVVQIIMRPPDMTVLLVQVMAMAAVVDKAKISPMIVFILIPCLNDKTPLPAL